MTWPPCASGWSRQASASSRAARSRSTSLAARLTARSASTFKLQRVSSSNSSSGLTETMSPNRLEAFSDGVFAIAATLLILNVMCQYAAQGGRLLRENASARVVKGITRSYLPGPFIYLVATIAALVSPQLSAVLYAGIALFYVLESSVFGGRA